MGAFGSDNQSNTNAPNNSLTLSDNALAISHRLGRGNQIGDKITTNTRVGGDLTINNGVGEDALRGGFSSLLRELSPTLDPDPDPVGEAIDKRIVDNIEAPTRERTFGVGNWILIAVGVVILFGAVLFKRKHK